MQDVLARPFEDDEKVEQILDAIVRMGWLPDRFDGRRAWREVLELINRADLEFLAMCNITWREDG